MCTHVVYGMSLRFPGRRSLFPDAACDLLLSRWAKPVRSAKKLFRKAFKGLIFAAVWYKLGKVFGKRGTKL